MSWRKWLFLLVSVGIAFRLPAQLPNGSLAPDFIAADINGQTHHLYELLDSGKIVVLEISATWCAPCWVYHTSHAMQDLYNAHGPAGDDKLRVLWIEGDPNTNLNCLYGSAGCNGGSAGNFVAGTPYPILDNTAIANAYQITYYPSIFIICPNKRTYEVDPIGADALWAKAQECPVAFGQNNAGIFQYNPGTPLTELCDVQNLAPSFALTNLGSSPLSTATIELKWNANALQTIQWTGNLPTYGEAIVSFSPQGLSGEGILKTTIVNINGGTGDEDFSNNVRNDNFTIAPQFNTTQVLLKIRTDNYGEETYWELRDDLGAVLDHGGNLNVGPNGGGAFPLGTPIGPGAYPNLSIIRDTLQLPANGCYSIHFSDGYGDGMCCNFGTGYYKMYDLDAPTLPLITGGEFDDYSRRGFGVGELSAAQSPDQSIDLQVFPNPASEYLTIALETPGSFDLQGQIFNAIGQLQQTLDPQTAAPSGNEWRLNLSGWSEGIYFLRLDIAGKPVTRTFWVKR